MKVYHLTTLQSIEMQCHYLSITTFTASAYPQTLSQVKIPTLHNLPAQLPAVHCMTHTYTGQACSSYQAHIAQGSPLWGEHRGNVAWAQRNFQFNSFVEIAGIWWLIIIWNDPPLYYL